MKQRLLLCLLIISIILSNGTHVFSETTEISGLYVSPRAVTILFSQETSSVEVKMDGKILKDVSSDSDKTKFIFSTYEELLYDNWYALEVSVAGKLVYSKAISLSTLLYDNFEEDAAGFSAPYDSETKSMLLPRAINDYRIYKYAHGNDGFWDTDWKDYRIDIKLANDIDSSKFRLHIDAYLQSKTAGTTGVGFGIGVYGAYGRYDWFEQVYQMSTKRSKYASDGTGYDNLMYEIAGGDSSKELDNDTEYLHYIGLKESYRQSKDDVISFNVSKNSQAIMLNDEIRKVTSIDAENEYGGFLIYNWSTAGKVDEENPTLSENPAKIKEIIVYKLLEKNIQDVYHIENVLITNDGENFNLTYNIVTPDGQSDIGADIKWYLCDLYGDVFTEIDGHTSAVLPTEGLENKIIRAVVTLKDILNGVEVSNSALYIPEAPPVARDVKIAGEALAGESLKVEYTYFDINKNIEDTNNTKITWYASERKFDGYEMIGSGEIFEVKNAHWGKYIKAGVAPYATEAPFEGVEVFSEPIFIDLINKMYVSPRNIIINFLKPVNNIEVSIDDKALDISGVNENKTSYEYNLSGLEFDKWYKLVIKSDEVQLYSKEFRLKQLLQDDFESDVDGWINGIHDENGYLIIPKDENTATPPLVYFGDEEGFSKGQNSWQDYRIDIKLANSVNDKFRFYVEAYKPDIGVNEGFGISLRYFKNQESYNWFEMMYKTEVRPDLPYDIFLYNETEIDDSVAYLHKYGQTSHLEESNMLSFCVGYDSQTFMLGDKIKKTMKIPGGTSKGGFVMFNRANDFGEDVKIDEIAVYKFQENNDVIVSGTATKIDDTVSVSYNVTNIDPALANGVQVIIAAYEKNKLTDVNISDTVNMSDYGEISVNGNVILNVKNADTVKIFVWENTENKWSIKPLTSKVFEIPIS